MRERRVQKRQHFESVFLKINDKLSKRRGRETNEEYFKTIVPHERRKFIAAPSAHIF